MFFFEESVKYDHRTGDNVTPHVHDGYEIILYLKGSGIMAFGNEELPYQHRSVCIIPRHLRHYECTYTDTSVLTCVMDTDYFTLDKPYIFHGECYDGIITRLEEQLNELWDCAIKQHWTAGAREAEPQLMLIAHMISFMLDLYTHNDKKDITMVVEQAKRYIQHNWSARINFPILAESIGYSYSRLRHMFSDSVGIGLKEYQMGIRLSHAKELLTNSEQRISLIARRCGFQTPESFIAYFKKKYGCSPTAYRKASHTAQFRVFRNTTS